jgi:hypothetical protein
MNTDYGEGLEYSNMAEFDLSDLFDPQFGEADLGNFAQWNFRNSG